MGKDQDLIEAGRTGNITVIEKVLGGQKSKRSIGPISFASLRRGPNTNAQDINGDTALHLAALNGHLDAVKLLLKHEASTSVMDNRGCFPLHLAAWSGNLEICTTLLTQGPSISNANEQNTEGDTALHTAAQYGHTDVVLVLLENFADPGVRNKKGETPLDLAAQYGRLETVENIVKHSPQLLSCCTITHTPLHLASRNGHQKVVQHLLSCGFDVNTATDSGSALHEAAFFGKSDVVHVLMSYGIDTNLQNQDGKTALEIVETQTSGRAQLIAQIIKEKCNRKGNATVITPEPRSYPLFSRSSSNSVSIPDSKHDSDNNMTHSVSLYENVATNNNTSHTSHTSLLRRNIPNTISINPEANNDDNVENLYALERIIRDSVSSRSDSESGNNDLYQVPPSANRSLSQDSSFRLYKIPGSRTSGTSGVSNERHQSTSSEQDIYDTPPRKSALSDNGICDVLYQVPPSGGARKYSSGSESLPVCQGPPAAKLRELSLTSSILPNNGKNSPLSHGQLGSGDNNEELYNVPPSKIRTKSEGCDDELYQVPASCRLSQPLSIRVRRTSQSSDILSEVPPSPTQITAPPMLFHVPPSPTQISSPFLYQVPPKPIRVDATSAPIPPRRNSSSSSSSSSTKNSLYDVPPPATTSKGGAPAGYIPMDHLNNRPIKSVESSSTVTLPADNSACYKNFEKVLESNSEPKQEDNQYMLHFPPPKNSGDCSTEDIYMNTEQLNASRITVADTTTLADTNVQENMYVAASCDGNGFRKDDVSDSYFVNTGRPVSSDGIERRSFRSELTTKINQNHSEVFCNVDSYIYQNQGELANDSEGVYELLSLATSGRRETVESHDSSDEEVEIKAPPIPASRPIPKPPSLEFDKNDNRDSRKKAQLQFSATTKCTQPPTPDHPPPSPHTAIYGIGAKINPDEKRRSRDIETSTEEVFLAVEQPLPPSGDANEKAFEGTAPSDGGERDDKQISKNNPFFGLLKGSKPKGVRRAKTLYESTSVMRVKRNSLPGLFNVAFDPVAEKDEATNEVFSEIKKVENKSEQVAIGAAITTKSSASEITNEQNFSSDCSPLDSPVSEIAASLTSVQTRNRSRSEGGIDDDDVSKVKMRKQKSITRDDADEWNEIADIMATFGGRITTRGSMCMKDFDQEFAKLISGAGRNLSIGDWLESLKLEQYENLFIANGFDQMDFIAPNILEEADLLEMGIYSETIRNQILGSVRLMPPIAALNDGDLLVEDWLRLLRLSEYIDTFIKHGFLTMEKVRKLWELELTTVLDITRLGHRKRILASLGGHLADQTLEELGQASELRNLANSFSSDSESWSLNPLVDRGGSDLESPEVNLFRDYTGIMPLRSEKSESSPDKNLDEHQASIKAQYKHVSYSNLDIRPPHATMSVKSELIKGWRHRPDTLVKGCCNYVAHYLGSTLVKELSGIGSTKQAIIKMKKMTDSIYKVPSIILSISYHGVKFIDSKSKNVICEHEIGNIFCACQDGDDLNYFAYITKDLQTGHHYCHVFRVKGSELAAEIILTLGEAFEVAYQIAKLEEAADAAIDAATAEINTSMAEEAKAKPDPHN